MQEAEPSRVLVPENDPLRSASVSPPDGGVGCRQQAVAPKPVSITIARTRTTRMSAPLLSRTATFE